MIIICKKLYPIMNVINRESKKYYKEIGIGSFCLWLADPLFLLTVFVIANFCYPSYS